MQGIVLIIIMAIVVEAIVEYAKTIGKALTAASWKTAVTQLAAIAVGVLLCLMSGADLFAALDIVFAWPSLGVVLTGVFISRGANYVSDLTKRLQGVKKED